MAEKPLKSLRFHGLDDTYKIPSTAEDVGAATPEEVDSAKTSAINESKTYTNAAVQKARPRNLLDNSDFRNPVNQRGQDSYNGNVYGIDRWKGDSNDVVVTLLGDGITVMGDHLNQIISNSLSYAGKVLSFALCDSVGNIEVINTLIPAEIDKHKWLIQAGKQFDFGLWIEKNGDIYACFKNAESSNPIAWAALYEGEYTLETLPEYQSKGYGAELAECQRYCVLIPHTVEGFIIGYGLASTDTTAYITVDLPVTLQDYTNINPTIMGTFQMRGNGDIFDGASVTCFSYNGHKLVIECRVSSGLASMQFYVLRALENVLISKEL